MRTQSSHIPWIPLSDFTKNPKHWDQKIWYFFCNIQWHTEKVTDYVIINMICCSATLQKVKANLRKTITWLWLKEEQHRNDYKIKCFCTKLCLKGFFSCLIHYYFKGGVEENSTRQTLVSIFCFYYRTLFNKLIIEHTFISTKCYQTYVLTLV